MLQLHTRAKFFIHFTTLMQYTISINRGYMYDMFTRIGNTTILFGVAAIVKQERCTCIARHMLCHKFTETMLQNIHRIEFLCKMLRILMVTSYTGNHVPLLSQNSFKDVELPVQIQNHRCSHGFTVTDPRFRK